MSASAPRSQQYIWLKRALSVVLLALMLYFFRPILAELTQAAGLFRAAHWEWLLAAAAIQIVSYGFLTWLNLLSLQPFSRPAAPEGGRIGFVKLSGLLTAMAFVEIAVPSAGASGVALRVWLLGRHGYKLEEAVFSLTVETLAEMIALVTIGLLGIVYLLRSGYDEDMAWLFLIGAGVILAAWLAWRMFMNLRLLRRIVLAGARTWNRLGGRLRRLDLAYVDHRASVFHANLTRRMAQYRRITFWLFILAAYGKVLTDVASLWACYALFGFAVSPGALLTGYGLILAVSGLNVLPGGIGISELSVPVVLSNLLGVPGPFALVAGLTYRLVAFWAVRFIGFISFQFLQASQAGAPALGEVQSSKPGDEML